MCEYVRGEHHSNIPGCTTANSPIPRPTSGTQRIIQQVFGSPPPPPHPERHSSFCAAMDLTFDTARVKLDQIIHMWASERLLLHITFHPLLGPSDCRPNVQRHKRSYFPSSRCCVIIIILSRLCRDSREQRQPLADPVMRFRTGSPEPALMFGSPDWYRGGDGRYFLPLWSLFLEYRI
ncbi:hypothetical protein fugu_002540 [Takifugu bimaculatus]|uniref:Uncharacterized protein n=1 Tax=Takifugu bimaculatus TaxID=433685 RepID=A0A4Z2BQ10_9TELE|nr:hypothetical protein fugu_002540 [Takifugu bimaculatus]